MKIRHLLVTTLAFTLPAWSLSAQENTPPPRPPDAAPREGAPRPERREGEHRPMGGLFGALDANHDGVIDNEEVNRAADLLRKLDRNSDGKIGVDEFRGPGEGRPRRPEDGDRRGPDLRADGRGEPKRERGPEMHRKHDRKPDGDRDARPNNDAGPRCDSCPQARHVPAHRRHHQGPADSRTAQRGPRQPDHNRIGQQPRWQQLNPNRGPDNRYTFARRFDGSRPGPQPGERRDARGPAPQQWHHDARPPQGGLDGNRFANPPRGPQPQPQFGPQPRRYEPNRGDQRPSWQHPPRKPGPPPQGVQPRDNRGPNRPPQGPPPGPDGQQPRPPQGASFDNPEADRQTGPPAEPV